MAAQKEASKAQSRTTGPSKEAKPGPAQPRMSNIVRLLETNLDGSKPMKTAIQRIPGVGIMFSNAVAAVSGWGDRAMESLSAEELKRLSGIIQHAEGMPPWMLNRRRDPVDGKAKHLTASALDFAVKNDINEMKKLKTYKGVRHSYGLPVRGQRTRSSFRKGKTVGVQRQKEAPAKAKEQKKV